MYTLLPIQRDEDWLILKKISNAVLSSRKNGFHRQMPPAVVSQSVIDLFLKMNQHEQEEIMGTLDNINQILYFLSYLNHL